MAAVDSIHALAYIPLLITDGIANDNGTLCIAIAYIKCIISMF
jgi:hypothetical protein